MNNLIPYIALGIASILIAIAQIMLKISTRADQSSLVVNSLINFNLNLFIGMILYSMSFLVFLLALKSLPVSIAHPTMALSYVIVLILAYFFLDESLDYQKLIGITMIILGIMVIWK